MPPDTDPSTCRVGLIVLATDLATESDFHHALHGHDVAFHTTRIRNVNPCTVENLRTMGPKLADCASLLLPGMPLDVIAYSCTSGTVALGYEHVAAQVSAGRGDVPVVTPATAALAAFKTMGLKTIALMTPYIEPVGREIAAYLTDSGMKVVRDTHLDIADDTDMAFLTPDAIKQAAVAADHPEADGLFISCTAIRAMEVLADLEEVLQKPCLSSIQCLLWQALREGGYRRPIEGYGRLLEDRHIEGGISR